MVNVVYLNNFECEMNLSGTSNVDNEEEPNSKKSKIGKIPKDFIKLLKFNELSMDENSSTEEAMKFEIRDLQFENTNNGMFNDSIKIKNKSIRVNNKTLSFRCWK